MGGSYQEPPNKVNDTISEIEKANQAKTEAEAETAHAKKLAEEAAQREEEARNREGEALRREAEAREREADFQRREEEAKRDADQARHDAELAKQRGEESERREKAAKEKEAEAQRLVEESRKAALDAQNRVTEANDRVLEYKAREVEARKAADEARKREELLKKDLQQKTFYLDRGIQPKVWPTDEEFQLAKSRIEYDPEKLHIAVSGNSGSGKSSLVNAFRGLKNNKSGAAPTGVIETTKVITRYPDPRNGLPFRRLVWFDCPGAGTLEIPGWQYFNQQGLFIFDIIILVYDSRFTQIDISIIKNCERFRIPLFIVRSKADIHIQNAMKDLGYDDDVKEYYHEYEARARQSLIEDTKNDLERNLGKANLAKRDVFLVSDGQILSLVTKNRKTTVAIDEERLIEAVLTVAYNRRYDSESPTSNSKEHSTIIKDGMVMELLVTI